MARTKPDAPVLSDEELELLGLFVDEQLVIERYHGPMSISDQVLSLSKLENAKDVEFPNFFNIARRLQKKALLAQGNRENLQKFIDARAKELDISPSPTLNTRSSFHGPSALGKGLLANLRPRLEEIRQARSRLLEEGRIVVTKRHFNTYGRGYIPGVGDAYRVLRETASRLYAIRVVLHPEDPDRFIPERKNFDSYLRGSAPNCYLERDSILAENVTPAQYRRMLAATASFEASLGQANEQMENELAPIRQRFEQRRAQLLAQLEDEMQNAPEAPPEVGRAAKAIKSP